jgi:flagella basal body P-ring formation protein FlgA
MRTAVASILTILTLGLGTLLLSPSSVGADDRVLHIKIAEKATVSGDTVNLGHIATFQPGQDPRVAELRSVQIAAAPAPGNTYRFNRQFLDYKVGSAVADQGEDITLDTPNSIQVHRTAQIVTTARMEEIFRDHILETAPWPEDEITLESVRVPEDVALPEGALRWEIRENGNTDYLGNVSVTLTFVVDGRKIRRVPLSGRVSITRDVLQAARNIQRGDLIRAEDVLQTVKTTMRMNGDVLMDAGEAVGKRASRSIRAGRAITSAMVEDPPVVEKGSDVTIVAENDILRITTRGEALEEGRRGDRIRVRNLGSGKEITSTVRGPGRVDVVF